MKLQCNLCGEIVSSLAIDINTAIKEISVKAIQHLNSHPGEPQKALDKCKELFALATWLVGLQIFKPIERERSILELYDNQFARCAEILGVDNPDWIIDIEKDEEIEGNNIIEISPK